MIIRKVVMESNLLPDLFNRDLLTEDGVSVLIHLARLFASCCHFSLFVDWDRILKGAFNRYLD